MKKRTGSKRTVSVKAFVAILALVLALGCAAGGTFAWLVATTDTVTNTFTYGDIDIELTETSGNNYKIIPGVDLTKNPTVTVKANSEACWLFVKVEDSGVLKANRITYEIDTAWTKLEGVDNVYYCTVDATGTTPVSHPVLKDNKVIVSSDLTKTEIAEITAKGATNTLKFTAYAVQKDGIDDAATAWGKVSA